LIPEVRLRAAADRVPNDVDGLLPGEGRKCLRAEGEIRVDLASEILADAWTCSPEALESATGWRAATSLAAGLRQTADWYRSAEWL